MGEPTNLVPTTQCPTCGTYVAAGLPATRRQERLLDELLSDKHHSVEDAALAAGYAPSSAKNFAYVLTKKWRYDGTVAHRRNLRLDKATSLSQVAKRLVKAGADRLDAEAAGVPAVQLIQTGAVVAKIAHETAQDDPVTVTDDELDKAQAKRRRSAYLLLLAGLRHPRLVERLIVRMREAGPQHLGLSPRAITSTPRNPRKGA